MPIKVFIAGDVVPQNRTISLFKEKKTDILFGDMLHKINDADIRIVNLEAPVIYGKPSPIKKVAGNKTRDRPSCILILFLFHYQIEARCSTGM